jgi:hypothetical protein
MREKLPAPLRPFTRGVWPFVWVGVASVAAWWIVGGSAFEESRAVSEQIATQRRLVVAMRDAAASEDAERARAGSLTRWVAEEGPTRVIAPSVQIGVSRLTEKVQQVAMAAGDGVTVLPSDPGSAQIQAVLDTMSDGRSLHLVRMPLQVRAETMELMSEVIAAIESNGEIWLRPGNTTITAERGRQGQTARLNISQVWAIVEVRPEGG